MDINFRAQNVIRTAKFGEIKLIKLTKSVRERMRKSDNRCYSQSGSDSVATGNSNGYLNNSLSPRVPEDTRKTPMGSNSLGTMLSIQFPQRTASNT